MIEFKKKILNDFLVQLKQKLDILQASATAAHEAATSSESKAENKYDTRGLEASYLAGAQSKRAAETAEYINTCKNILAGSLESTDLIGWNSLITLKVDDQDEQIVFMLPFPGGLTTTVKSIKITAISLEAPLGKRLMGKNIGDFFELTIEGSGKEYEVISIS